MNAISSCRTRFTVIIAAITMVTFCMTYAHAQKPKVTVSVSGVPAQVQQMELLTGAVTITLSGLAKPVDIQVASTIFEPVNDGKRVVSRGNQIVLKQRGNGTHKLSLSTDIPVRTTSDKGSYVLDVDVWILYSRPLVNARTSRSFTTTSGMVDITLMENANNHLVIDSSQDSKQHRIVVRYVAANHTDKPVDIKLNQQVAVSGADDLAFTPDILKLRIAAKSEQIVSKTYSMDVVKPGVYTITCKVQCDKAKSLLMRVQHDEGYKAILLLIKNASVDSSSVEIGRPIRLRLLYELTNALPNLWPKVNENVLISGPENLTGSAIRYIDVLTDEGEGIYEAKLSKPGSYSWKVTLTSIFADSETPVVATGSFTVTRKTGSALKTVWVSSGGVDSGERSALQISAGSVVYNDAIGPERKIYTNRMSWTEPPLTVNEGDTLEFKTSCTQNEYAYLAGKYSMSGFGGENYQKFIGMVTCTNPKDGRDSYNMSLKFIPKETQKPYIEWSVGESPYTNSYLVRRWTYEKREVTPEAGDLPTGTLYDVTPVKPVDPKPKSEDSKTKSAPSNNKPSSAKKTVPAKADSLWPTGRQSDLFKSIMYGTEFGYYGSKLVIKSYSDPFIPSSLDISLGDELVSIEGHSVADMSFNDIEFLLKGLTGNKVGIELRRSNGQIHWINAKRP